MSYDITNIINSPYHKEANEHLNEDLPVEIIKPEALQEAVNSYDTRLQYLSHDLIVERIKYNVKDVISISETHGELSENSILLPFMVRMIRRYWLENTELGLYYKDGYLWTEEHEAIARIPGESENTIRGIVENLKKDSTISSVLNGNMITDGLRFRRNEIISTATRLGKYIQDNIVFKIDSEEYSTVCDGCPNNDTPTS